MLFQVLYKDKIEILPFEEIIINKENIRVSDNFIKPGDKYYAKRNGPGRILTCKSTIWSDAYKDNNFIKDLPGVKFDICGGYIVPEEMAYCYDFHECLKIEDTDSEKINNLWLELELEYEEWRK